MVALGAAARTTVRGEKTAHISFTDPLENRGWAVWHAIRTGKVRVGGEPMMGPADKGLQDVPGWAVEINMTTKMRDLWQEFAQADNQTKQGFASEVRQFLNHSGNAICLRSPGLGTGPGAKGQPLWWIRDEWNDVKAIGIYRTTELTDRERRLTPAEAGEDRPPAPVTVTQLDAAAAEDEQASGRAEEIAAIWEQRKNQIVEELRRAEQPLYQLEISERTGITNWAVGRAVREMISQGDTRIARRLEENEDRPATEMVGRRHYLYWHEAPVPRRDPDTFRHTQTIMDRVNQLQPGRTMTTRWITAGPMKEIQELIDAGVLVLLDKGTENERIMIADDSIETVENVVEETVVVPEPEPEPATAPQALTGAGTPLSLQIEQMIEAEVQRRAGGQADLIRRLRLQVENAEAQRDRVQAELNELNERFTAARRAFGL